MLACEERKQLMMMVMMIWVGCFDANQKTYQCQMLFNTIEYLNQHFLNLYGVFIYLFF